MTICEVALKTWFKLDQEMKQFIAGYKEAIMYLYKSKSRKASEQLLSTLRVIGSNNDILSDVTALTMAIGKHYKNRIASAENTVSPSKQRQPQETDEVAQITQDIERLKQRILTMKLSAFYKVRPKIRELTEVRPTNKD